MENPSVPASLRIFAWNPNGIRALIRNTEKEDNIAEGDLERFIKCESPDILFFPETKGNPKAQFETQCKLETIFKRAAPDRKWKWYWSHCERPGRHGNGVAVNKEIVVERVKYNFGDQAGHETEGRIIALKLHERNLWVMGLYIPNASSGLSRLDHKLQWLGRLRADMDAMRAEGNTVVVIGDINVAPDMRDLCNPSSNLKTPGYSKAERDRFEWLMEAERDEDDTRFGLGYVDVWRQKHPLPFKSQGRKGVYSFWSTRSKARERNAGWRIDLVLMDRETYGSDGEGVINDVMICDEYYGSDHCPVGVDIQL